MATFHLRRRKWRVLRFLHMIRNPLVRDLNIPILTIWRWSAEIPESEVTK